ncbi:MAG: DASS family sodium-coupled anion symporter [Mariprofundus sp.]|nr:DASS family sodium-coupled anion symporter [Mariprofundus sp.]
MPVRIDHSPLHMLLARKGFPFAALTVLAVIAYVLLNQQGPEGLSNNGWQALIVFGVCLILWVTQLLPHSVTSLLGLALLPLLGVLPADQAYSMFGNSAVFFILGAFMLAAGVMKTGLSEHLALALIDKVGLGPKRLLLAMLLLPALFAAFMPEHAVVAVMLPIAWEIVRGLKLNAGHRYAQALFLALAWGAIIGGVTTLLGGARGPLALALVEELTGQTFSFADWTIAALPLVIAMLVVATLVLLLLVPFEGLDIQAARERIEKRRLELGQLSAQGYLMGLLLLGTVMTWIIAGHQLGLASIALVSVVMMFALRLVTWKAVEKHVDWGVVLMYGGAIAIGKALTVTGAASWLAHAFIPAGMGGLALLALLALVTLLMTEAVSNAAAVAILLPVAMSAGISAGIDPITVALAIGVIAGFAFMLPMGTPPNAMVFGTGYVESLAMLRYGAILSVSALLFFILLVWAWWPVAGFGIG